MNTSSDLVEAPLSDLSYSCSDSIALFPLQLFLTLEGAEVVAANWKMENGPEHDGTDGTRDIIAYN